VTFDRAEIEDALDHMDWLRARSSDKAADWMAPIVTCIGEATFFGRRGGRHAAARG